MLFDRGTLPFTGVLTGLFHFIYVLHRMYRIMLRIFMKWLSFTFDNVIIIIENRGWVIAERKKKKEEREREEREREKERERE